MTKHRNLTKFRRSKKGRIPTFNVLGAAASPVDLDATIMLQVLIFFLLLFLLTYLLYRPLLALLDARFSMTHGAREEAQKVASEAEAMEQEYSSRMRAHKKEAQEFVAQLRRKVKADEAEIVEKARKEAALVLAEARKQLKEIEANLRKGLEPQINVLAEELAAKILGEDKEKGCKG